MNCVRCFGTPECFFAIHTKGNNYCDFVYGNIDNLVLLKWDLTIPKWSLFMKSKMGSDPSKMESVHEV